LSNKANTADFSKLRLNVAEMSDTLKKGFDSIILSAKNEIKLAIANSASQDDFTFLKETKVDKDAIQELVDKVKEMENKVSEFQENNEISFSAEGEDTDEHMDDVMDIDRQDELLQEEQYEDFDGSFRRDKSWNTDVAKLGMDFEVTLIGVKSPEIMLPTSEQKVPIQIKGVDFKEDAFSKNARFDLSNKDILSINEVKSGESGESPLGMRRNPIDPKLSDLHMQSKLSTQSFKTGMSKIASSKNLNQYGFGNSFFQKYQAQLKGKKGPKFLIRYLQVQINDMCSKMLESFNMAEIVRTDLSTTKEMLFDHISSMDDLTTKFSEISSNYAHMEEDYQHVTKYYEFSKMQHEEVLQYLYSTEKAVKSSEKEMKDFVKTQNSEIEDKRKRIVNLEADFRQLSLEIKLVKEQKQKYIEELTKKIDEIRKNDNSRDEKLDDVIREISNIDFKHSTQGEIFNNELQKIQKPIKDQMINMQKENEVLLRELGRTQKDYRLMLSDFYNAVSNEANEADFRSQILNKTGEIMSQYDNLSSNDKHDCLRLLNRPATTVHNARSKVRTAHGSIPLSLKSSPKRSQNEKVVVVSNKSPSQNNIT
jgi:hypothetical protein